MPASMPAVVVYRKGWTGGGVAPYSLGVGTVREVAEQAAARRRTRKEAAGGVVQVGAGAHVHWVPVEDKEAREAERKRWKNASEQACERRRSADQSS